MDRALDLLIQLMRDDAERKLWLVDENAAGLIPVGLQNLHCLCNRIDVYEQLKSQSYHAHLCDFDFSATTVPSSVYFRVSKEKLLVHYLINQSLALMPVGGCLVLSGDKNEGIKTYAKKAAQLVSSVAQMEKHGDSWVARIEKRAQVSGSLNDRGYSALRALNVSDRLSAEQLNIVSKPGVFGWEKVDIGSALLAQCLPAFLAGLPQGAEAVLDLGCGYGYLSLQAIKAGARKVTATDNNMAAIAACRANLAEEKAEVVLANCGEGIAQKFDAVLCNPPFHQGFDMRSGLGEQFLRSARQRLLEHGQALFVVNEFIALERHAATHFSQCKLLRQERGFKVFQLSL